jgi:hypothetical protein
VSAPVDESGYQQWQPQPHIQPQPSGFRYLWNHPVVIAGVMGLLLLMVTAISIIAIKAVGSADDTRDTGEPNRVDPTQQATGQQAAPAGTGTPPANTQPAGTTPAGTAPAVNTTGAVFLSGKLDIRYYDSGVDFDTAKKDSLAGTEKFDLDPTETALNAVNRAQVGIGVAGAPSPAACTAAAVRWGSSAHVSVLADGATICVKTSDDRLAAFTVAKLEKDSDGQLSGVEVEYVVWKKQGDA